MKQETLQLTGGAGKDKRRELDYYPTPKNVTRALMNFMFKNGCMESTTTIWEPACGDGAMSEILMEYCSQVYSSDLRETGYGDGNVDFLREQHPMKFDAIISVTAYSSKESKEFQKHYNAVKFCIENELSFPKETSDFFKGKIDDDDLEDIAPAYILQYIENGVKMEMPREYKNDRIFIRVKDIPFGCDLIIAELV